MKRVRIEVSDRTWSLLVSEAKERGMTVTELCAFLITREADAGHEVEEED